VILPNLVHTQNLKILAMFHNLVAVVYRFLPKTNETAVDATK